MTLPGPRHYADVEAALVAHLSPLIGASIGAVSTVMPTTPTYPFVLVTEIPSGGDSYVFARRICDVEVFAPDRGTAKEASRVVHDRMMHLRNTYVGGVAGAGGVPILNVRCINDFGWIDYQDPLVHRYLAEYEVESAVTAQLL